MSAIFKETGGKFLTFLLGGEEYAVEAMKVIEIIGIQDITTVPQTPDFVKGVINLRGKVIPVIDLRVRLGLAELSYTDETCIIVVDAGGVLMGTVVDTVVEVVDFTEDEVEEAPSFGVKVNTDYILGMGKTENKTKVLIDIDRVLTGEELSSIDGMA